MMQKEGFRATCAVTDERKNIGFIERIGIQVELSV